MINNNGASIRRLSNRSLKNSRMRNFFAIAAISLTSILFTAVFSLTGGAMQMSQESIMREVGGKFHAGLKAATTQQYEKVILDPLIQKATYNIYIGYADNIVKRMAELRYTPFHDSLQDMFITLEEGHMPEAENEIVVDSCIMEELQLPCALGEKVTLSFRFQDRMVENEFVVSGWYQGDLVAHASELFVSERYWMKLKGSLTDEDFVRWGEAHPEDAGVGLKSVNVFFEDASDIEEKVCTVIQNAGYEPGTELAYGVNWAYMQNRFESLDLFSVVIVIGVAAVILITGYLIIYNIFQISVVSDIRFYGLLKTIGTTKRQIRRLVRRQAAILSLIGIPVGLLIGYGIGKLALPFALSFGDFGGMEISLKFHPWILVFSAVFSAVTVFLGSWKPGRIAGKVSPIEAVKYTETGIRGKAASRKKKRKHNTRNYYSAFSMALSNLGRNKRTTVMVIMAMSLSIILLTMVMTAAGSFRIDQYLEQRIVGDFVLGNIEVTSGMGRSGDITIEPEFLALADEQDGIEEKQELWTAFQRFLQMDDQARERMQELDGAGMLRRDVYESENLDRMLQGESMEGFCYGYSEGLLSNLEVLEGTLDVEKFATGDYILVTPILGNDDFLPAAEHIWHPGDTVTVESVTETSQVHEILDAGGETIGLEYDGLAEKEYEVMAIVDIPRSMNLGRYRANGCDVVMPLSEFDMAYSRCFGVAYQIREEKQEAFEAAVKAYTEEHTQMGYVSKGTLQSEFVNMVTVITTIGIALAGLIALIGTLNFINAVITEIISRKREFAMLQSIGMTNAQLKKTLICEGISYIAIAGVISFVLGSFLACVLLRAMNHIILFFEYQFQILPFVIMIPILMLVAVLVPVLSYRNLQKKSIVERLREE